MLDSQQPLSRAHSADNRGRARRRDRAGVVSPYDFRRPIQLSREHSRILQIGFDAFARQATTVFTSALRSVCAVSLTSIDQRTYAEYVDSLPGSTYMTMFSAEPLPGRGVLEIPLSAVMSCVDHMLGGPGTANQPQRPLTDIEAGVVRGFLVRLLSEMRYSLAEIVSLDPVVTGNEYSPQFAQVAGATDVVVVATFELRIDEVSHRMTICLQFSGLLPHLTRAATPTSDSDRERAARARAAVQIEERFSTVPVSVAVRIRPTAVDPEFLTDLRPGSVIRLAHPASAPLDVVVEDQVFAHATPGAQGQRLAALIVGVPSKEHQ